MSQLTFHVVDAFTSKPFAGNPAGVTLLEKPLSELAMQTLAQEINLSETAFLVPREGGFGLRWFTPNGEVDLCGHATLASAHWLWESGTAKDDEIRFFSKSGELKARRGITLDFPAEPVKPQGEFGDLLREALGCEFKFLGKNRMDFLVEVADESTLLGLKPDMKALMGLPDRGLIVTAPGQGGFHYKARCFYPKYNVDEDPVTGSAHCALAPYWGEKLGLSSMKAYQGLARGGEIEVEPKGDRVLLKGQAVTTFSSQVLVDLPS